MSLATIHPEDVKSAIRKRFRSVAAFERAKGLPPKSVNDLLRGRASQRVSQAVEKIIDEADPASSEVSDDSADAGEAHRFYGAAK